jgi:hypothetical protein
MFSKKSSHTLAALILGIVLAVPSANARITRIVITSTQSPTFGGAIFGDVGQYEKLVGQAFGEVDPNDPKNALIADIALAPRNVKGMVEYSMDIYILRPVDPAQGNRVLFEINSHGSKFALSILNDSNSGGNDPTTAADAGSGFLMREGYSIVWSGWDVTVASGGNNLTITVPVAVNPDGSTITGPALEETANDGTTANAFRLTYPAATADQSQANLTVRTRYADTPVLVPASDWQYINAQTGIGVSPKLQYGSLYEFTYIARNPLVSGLAFAATRDFAAFLHRATADDLGNPNPLVGRASYIYSYSFSEPARFMHDFLYLGFNEDEQGLQVFDGIENWIGGGNGGFTNYRFAQPGRTHRQHIGRWYPEFQFPFTNQVITDPVTGKTDGRLSRCLATNTCPKIIEANSGNEYWSKAGSLLHTDTLGNDLDLTAAPNVRYYHFSSLPHSSATPVPGICQQARNWIGPDAGTRALLLALDEWVSWGVKPPANEVPKRANGSLAPSLPQESVGFPTIPGVTYNGVLHTGDLYDFGPLFASGVLTTLPPAITESAYPVLVPRTDPDGIDIAGIRYPEVAVPMATYTGWGLRAGPAAGEGCDAYGQEIPFANTAAERLANGDPRLSIEERYVTHDGYVQAVVAAVRKLVKQRFLLEEDAQFYINQAETSNVLQPANR